MSFYIKTMDDYYLVTEDNNHDTMLKNGYLEFSWIFK
jgi:hypothetical protein